MNEADHHRLAMRGGGALGAAQADEQRRMAKDAQRLRAWQREQRAPGVRAIRAAAVAAAARRAHALRVALDDVTHERARRARGGKLKVGRSISGWPVLWAQVQWHGQPRDYASPNFTQHIQPTPTEVVMLPLETLTFVGSSSWTQATVVPGTLSPINDGATGLDTLNQDSNAPWGIDARGPYYETEGAPTPAHCFIDANGPYLSLAP